ncbi:hypothetical protein [Actinomyces faecalis]|uniref:hypothetical protein n=1 Tax=Actinomyces faecalis TaxID=2722820 RepID=UPI001553A433|nr:hypothetical protein [Actinomyces faecalis]
MIRRRDAVVLSLTGVSGYTALSTLAVSNGGTVLPSLIVSTGPLWVLALTSTLDRSRPRRLALVGTVVSVAGTIGFLLLGGSGLMSVSWLAAALATAAVVSMACYSVHFAHLTRTYHGPMAPVILPIYGWGLVPLSVWAALELARGHRLTLQAFIVLAALGLLVYLPVYLIQHRLLASVGAHTVSLLGLTVTPLVALETGLLRLGPWPGGSQWLMVGLTVLGMAMVIGPRRRQTDTQSRRA